MKAVVMVDKPRKFPPGCVACCRDSALTSDDDVVVDKPRKFPPGCGRPVPSVARTDTGRKWFLERRDSGCGGKQQQQHHPHQQFGAAATTPAKIIQPSSSSASSSRLQVKEKLKLFRDKRTELSRHDSTRKLRRLDIAALRELKLQAKIKHPTKKLIGSIPGINIGDVFRCRAELVITGLHTHLIRGIDHKTHHHHNGKQQVVATCVVATEEYMDRMKSVEVMTYVGEGGVVNTRNKNLCDQKLKRGNLALRNSQQMKLPVRVVRGFKRCGGRTSYYVYYGLYLVSDCVKKRSGQGNLVYEFELCRLSDQPPPVVS